MSTLEQWEKRLKPFFNHNLGFIGEIQISENDLDDLCGEVKTLIVKNGLGNASDVLTQKFPLSLLTLMASFAAYNTEQNFWLAFGSAIGVKREKLFNQGWHKNFVRLAQKQGLKVFDFEDDPTPYVTSIRFQGGIPSYSLPDYFEKMILPSIERPALKEVKPRQALDYLIEHTYFVDSPVFDFLSNSGDLGVEFFAETCKLARHAMTNHGAMLTIDDVELPEYVVNKFADWWEHREDAEQHWSKPYLQAAPYSEDSAVNLILPQQEITLDLAASRLFWRITYPKNKISQERPCRAGRGRQYVVTEKDIVPIPEVLDRVEISLNAIQAETGDHKELRCWNIPLIPPGDRTPLVAFNAQYVQITSTRQLPKEDLFLLTPNKSEMIFDGEGRQVEELPQLVGKWKDWKLGHWDLSQAWSVMLAQEGQPLGEIIPVQSAIPHPELTGGHLFQFQDQNEPLYTSDTPSLKIPLRSGNNPQARLSTWQVHIYSQLEAAPQLDKNIRLSEFADQLEIQGDYGIFSLKHIFGETAAGTYEIRVTGPRGLSGEFRIHLWPKLLVIGHTMQLTSPELGPKSSVFSLRLQDCAGCEAQPGFEELALKQTGPIWQVSAPPEFNRAQLYLTAPSDGGGKVRVPVTFPLPKLRWCLATEKDQVEWGQTLIRRSIDQIQQAGNASIHVEMYGLGNLGSVKIRLVELGDHETMLQEAKLIRTDFTNDWMRVTLGQFGDTLRHINSLAQFMLVYTPVGTDTQEVHFPLLEVSRALEISDVDLKPVSDTTWRLTWREDQTLSNRRVMIRPAWQPWQKPWEYKIPNNAQGEYIIEDISLPKTRFHLYFYVLRSENSPLEETPQALTPIIKDLCTPQERLDALPLNCPAHNERFKNLVEIAAIHDSLGDESKRDEILSTAASSIIHLTNLGLLTSTLKWMKNKNIFQPIKSFFFNKMFNIQIVEPMLRNHHLYDPALVGYLAFASEVINIPSDSAKLLLNRIDDPITLAICLKHLFNKKDGDLPAIMVKMITEARLSKRDVLDLLSNDPIWAIERIAEFESNPYSDSLIAGLLPKAAQKEDLNGDERLAQWMMRSLPYENDKQLIHTYIRYFFATKFPKRFESLMNALIRNDLSPDDAKEFLSLNPKDSLIVLESAPNHEEHKKWIAWLVEEFPAIDGIITPGNLLMTPFGTAEIKSIEKWNGGQVNCVRLGEKGHCIRAAVGSGSEKIQLLINYMDMTISIAGVSRVWKCSNCRYLHPQQSRVMDHGSHEHGKMAFKPVTMPMGFESNEVQVLIIDSELKRH